MAGEQAAFAKMENAKKATVSKGETKRCFVITPIGDPASAIHRSAMGLIESVIRPVFETRGYDVKAAHEISDPGSINDQIINRLLEDDFAVANLTGLNPNVMYELAVRHAIKKPLICLAEHGTVLPFDLKDERTIFYQNDMRGVEEVRPRLESMINAIDNEWKADNPITRGSVKFEIEATRMKATESDLIIRSLDDLRRTVGRLSRDRNIAPRDPTRDPFFPGSIIQTTIENIDLLRKALTRLAPLTFDLRVEGGAVVVFVKKRLTRAEAKILGDQLNGRPLSIIGVSETEE